MTEQRLAIPEFWATGVDGITALTFEPPSWPTLWPPTASANDHRVVMRVVHKASGVGRPVAVQDLDRLIQWLTDGVHELEIFDDRRTGRLTWSAGYVEAHVWNTADGPPMRRFNHAFRTTLEPRAVTEVVKFLDRIRHTGWTAWDAERRNRS